MRVITAEKAAQLTSSGLGMATQFLSSVEGMAAFTRRVASYACPCTERLLIKSLCELLAGLDAGEEVSERVRSVIAGLLDQGDLLEVEDPENGSLVLALRAPSVFKVSTNSILLLGLSPDGADVPPLEFQSCLLRRGYARILAVQDSTETLNKLHLSGFLVITDEEWGLPPVQGSSRKHVDAYLKKFRTDTHVGHIEGLRLLDQRRPVTYYTGRWESKNLPNGAYVAKRLRKFGYEAWCFIKMGGGNPLALVDFPTKNFSYRACDEAWHLQQAIDREAGTPQRYRVKASTGNEGILELFSPVPQWAHKRWSLLGEQTSMRGALFAYRFPTTALEAEIEFAETRMWLSPL